MASVAHNLNKAPPVKGPKKLQDYANKTIMTTRKKVSTMVK